MKKSRLSVVLSMALGLSFSIVTGGTAVSILSRQAHATPMEFSSVVARVIFLKTEAGRTLVSRITRTPVDELNEGSFQSFLQRLRWNSHRNLRHELENELEIIHRNFAARRRRYKQNPEVTEGQRLTRAELEFLSRQAEQRLSSNRLVNLLDESISFIELSRGSYSRSKANFEKVAAETAAAERVGEVPPLPRGTQAGREITEEQLALAKLSWRKRIATRFRAYGAAFSYLKFSEGEIRTLAGLSGRKFTVDDVRALRKMNALLDALNGYSKFKLIMKSFVQEKPGIYRRLNEETSHLIQAYVRGELSPAQLIAERRLLLEELGLNEVVYMAETRMINTLEKLRNLAPARGASHETRGLIQVAEENLRTFEARISESRRLIQDLNSKVTTLRNQLARTGAKSERMKLERQIVAAQKAIGRERLNLNLWHSGKQAETRNLEGLYFEFVENYETLELFTNLRAGKIGPAEAPESVIPFDIPEPFVMDPTEAKAWLPVYERALYNSTHKIVVSESRIFFSSRVGHTRRFIRELNQSTGRFFGEKFTETPHGRAFRSYAERQLVVVAQRMFALLGITVPTAYLSQYAEGFVDAVFREEKEPANEDELNHDNRSRNGSRSGWRLPRWPRGDDRDPSSRTNPRFPGFPGRGTPPPLGGYDDDLDPDDLPFDEDSIIDRARDFDFPPLRRR